MAVNRPHRIQPGSPLSDHYTVVGDCRAIICNKESKSMPITIDHKPNDINEKALQEYYYNMDFEQFSLYGLYYL